MTALTYDYTNTRRTTLPLRKVRNPRLQWIIFAVAAIAFFAGGLSIVWSDLVENRIAYDIIHHQSYILKFTVAGHEYMVVTPKHELTDRQREAYFNYARKMGYPLYAADGAMTIDP